MEGKDNTVEETSSTSTPARPSLPRLNSQSRAPPSNSTWGSETPGEESQQHDSAADQAHDSAATGAGPVHVKESREIPLHPKQSSEAHEQEDETDAPASTPAAGRAAGDQGSRSGAPSPAMSSSLKNKEESDGENPTIQIPKVTSVASGLTLPPNLAELATNLEGKYVDEFGNVLDWDGRVLGRVEGDLPSMIGRPVAATGEVLSEDDEVVGYVAENETIQPAVPPPRPIHGMGKGLKVDHLGNILDQDDNVVGHFNSDHMGKALEQKEQSGQSGTNSQGQGDAGQENSDARPRNPKPTAAPSPSEIYLDVKSTNDGVQLIIKIPTVFNGGGGPNIHISSSS